MWPKKSESNYGQIFRRLILNDPEDDMILELAVRAGCQYIVTYNKRDFEGVNQFGIKPVTAKEFLQIIKEIP